MQRFSGLKLALVLLVTLSAGGCRGARLLRAAPSKDGGRLDTGDGSGYSAYANARSVTPPTPPTNSRSAFTETDAEAVSASGFRGIHRLTAPAQRRTYATVEGEASANWDREDTAIKPRARSTHDAPKGPDNQSGNVNMPTLVMGGVAYSQTYEGASSISATDALAMSKGQGVAMAASVRTQRVGPLRNGVLRPGSWGVTAQPVGSLALSGAANGGIVLAQADSAVAMVQTERASKWDN